MWMDLFDTTDACYYLDNMDSTLKLAEEDIRCVKLDKVRIRLKGWFKILLEIIPSKDRIVFQIWLFTRERQILIIWLKNKLKYNTDNEYR